jgi:hypothetical protein
MRWWSVLATERSMVFYIKSGWKACQGRLNLGVYNGGIGQTAYLPAWAVGRIGLQSLWHDLQGCGLKLEEVELSDGGIIYPFHVPSFLNCAGNLLSLSTYCARIPGLWILNDRIWLIQQVAQLTWSSITFRYCTFPCGGCIVSYYSVLFLLLRWIIYTSGRV